ncbi:hypothetical protein LCGC14_2786280, partial [marine sediment metagenome]
SKGQGEQTMINKLNATKGTIAVIDNLDLTSWVLAGWALIESVSIGQVKVIRL